MKLATVPRVPITSFTVYTLAMLEIKRKLFSSVYIKLGTHTNFFHKGLRLSPYTDGLTYKVEVKLQDLRKGPPDSKVRGGLKILGEHPAAHSFIINYPR